MSAISIMPCLDIKDGRVVKGVHFVDLQDVGDPFLAAQAYVADGARELTLLDITATVENRKTTLAVIEQISTIEGLTLTVGGGIRSVADAKVVLGAGATRVSISSAAVTNPGLIDELASRFGSERLVVALDVDRSTAVESGYEVFTHGGRTATGVDAIALAQDAERRGAGILLPTSKATDGARHGYDIPLLRLLREHVSIPIVASGGAGNLEHFLDAAQAGATYLLAASVFHFGEINIRDLARFLQQNGIELR